jgi:hypothetical protein
MSQPGTNYLLDFKIALMSILEDVVTSLSHDIRCKWTWQVFHGTIIIRDLISAVQDSNGCGIVCEEN